MNLDQMRERAKAIADLYDQLNQARIGRVWDRIELTLGFVGDLGKLVMAADGTRASGDDGDALWAKVDHEIADCLWSVLTIADRCGTDLAAAFTRTMDQLEGDIANKLTQLDQMGTPPTR